MDKRFKDGDEIIEEVKTATRLGEPPPTLVRGSYLRRKNADGMMQRSAQRDVSSISRCAIAKHRQRYCGYLIADAT